MDFLWGVSMATVFSTLVFRSTLQPGYPQPLQDDGMIRLTTLDMRSPSISTIKGYTLRPTLYGVIISGTPQIR